MKLVRKPPTGKLPAGAPARQAGSWQGDQWACWETPPVRQHWVSYMPQAPTLQKKKNIRTTKRSAFFLQQASSIH